MCERFSWGEKEVNGKTVVLVVTAKEIYHTEQGKKTQKHCNNDPTEYWGHSALAFYYGVDPATIRHRECVDFSTPDVFPPELVAAIKAGDMAEFGVTDQMISGLLSQKGRQKYKSKCKANVAWQKAYATWQKVDAARQKAYAARQKADADWRKADTVIFWGLFAGIRYRAEAWK